MRNKKDFLDIDFIGGLGSLTKEDEQKLTEYFKNKKKTESKGHKGNKRINSKNQKV
jgi:hypothetical protein